MTRIDEFIDKFLTGKSLQDVVCLLCNQCCGLSTDPITDTLVVVATTPICVVVTETGLSLFQNQPSMVFPYSHMSRDQLDFVNEKVKIVLELSRENHSNAKGQIQMGGGCILMITPQSKHSGRILNAVDIVNAFVDSVIKSDKQDNWCKKAICNIILQRVSCAVNMPNEAIHTVAQRLEKNF